MISQAPTRPKIGLMFSGGLDSAVLLAHLLDEGFQVQPFYVATGCYWEAAEREAVGEFLAAYDQEAICPLVDQAMPVAELYGAHWSITGRQVPDTTSPDEAVALPGRNPLLLLKPLLWCGQHDIPHLVLGTLSANPFADATPEFFDLFQRALTAATQALVKISSPFANKSKSELLELATDLPIHLTFSCFAPHNGLHCGNCNKCAERARALQALPQGDPTIYANSVPAEI